MRKLTISRKAILIIVIIGIGMCLAGAMLYANKFNHDKLESVPDHLSGDGCVSKPGYNCLQ